MALIDEKVGCLDEQKDAEVIEHAETALDGTVKPVPAEQLRGPLDAAGQLVRSLNKFGVELMERVKLTLSVHGDVTGDDGVRVGSLRCAAIFAVEDPERMASFQDLWRQARELGVDQDDLREAMDKVHGSLGVLSGQPYGTCPGRTSKGSRCANPVLRLENGWSVGSCGRHRNQRSVYWLDRSDPITRTTSCGACHLIVKEKGPKEVFFCPWTGEAYHGDCVKALLKQWGLSPRKVTDVEEGSYTAVVSEESFTSLLGTYMVLDSTLNAHLNADSGKLRFVVLPTAEAPDLGTPDLRMSSHMAFLSQFPTVEVWSRFTVAGAVDQFKLPAESAAKSRASMLAILEKDPLPPPSRKDKQPVGGAPCAG